jgi:hypothetical protein
MRHLARKKVANEARIENTREYLDREGVHLYGEWEKGFPSWLIEEYGFRPYQRIPIDDNPLVLEPEGEIAVIHGHGAPCLCYTMTRASLEKVWEKYGPPVPRSKKNLPEAENALAG